MKRLVRMLVLVAALGVAGAAAQSVNEAIGSSVSAGDVTRPQQAPQVKADEYVIGADDVLAVNVWKEPELSRTLPVRPDGKITLPLLGEIQARGATPHDLQEEIRTRLKAFVSNPEVTVIVQEVKSLKFNIVGEVTKPGSYVLTQPTTVLDAIAMAGGLRDFAKQNGIYILRTSRNGTQIRVPFEYKKVIKARKQDVELLPRDTVVVP